MLLMCGENIYLCTPDVRCGRNIYMYTPDVRYGGNIYLYTPDVRCGNHTKLFQLTVSETARHGQPSVNLRFPKTVCDHLSAMLFDPSTFLLVFWVIVVRQAHRVTRPAQDGATVTNVAHNELSAVAKQTHCGRCATVECIRVYNKWKIIIVILVAVLFAVI